LTIEVVDSGNDLKRHFLVEHWSPPSAMGLAASSMKALWAAGKLVIVSPGVPERTRFKGGWCAEKGKAGAKATAKP
jgi:hypothetical protein